MKIIKKIVLCFYVLSVALTANAQNKVLTYQEEEIEGKIKPLIPNGKAMIDIYIPEGVKVNNVKTKSGEAFKFEKEENSLLVYRYVFTPVEFNNKRGFVANIDGFPTFSFPAKPFLFNSNDYKRYRIFVPQQNNPNCYQPKMEKGKYLYEQDKYSEAIDKFEEAIECHDTKGGTLPKNWIQQCKDAIKNQEEVAAKIYYEKWQEREESRLKDKYNTWWAYQQRWFWSLDYSLVNIRNIGTSIIILNYDWMPGFYFGLNCAWIPSEKEGFEIYKAAYVTNDGLFYNSDEDTPEDFPIELQNEYLRGNSFSLSLGITEELIHPVYIGTGACFGKYNTFQKVDKYYGNDDFWETVWLKNIDESEWKFAAEASIIIDAKFISLSYGVKYFNNGLYNTKGLVHQFGFGISLNNW